MVVLATSGAGAGTGRPLGGGFGWGGQSGIRRTISLLGAVKRTRRALRIAALRARRMSSARRKSTMLRPGVDDFYEGGPNGLLVVDEGDGVRGRGADAADHALVEVAELLSAESRGSFDCARWFALLAIGLCSG